MKAVKLLFIAASVLMLSAFDWQLEDKTRDYGVVMMPNFYSATLPQHGFMGKPTGRMEKIGYYTAMRFVSRNDGGVYVFGTEKVTRYASRNGFSWGGGTPGTYRSMYTKPGVYDLTAFYFMGNKQKHDAKKCGNLSFSIGKDEVVVIKGPKPATPIEDYFGRFLYSRFIPDAFRFTNLPDGYREDAKDDLAKGRKLKVVELKSDNPKAYEACVKQAMAEDDARRKKHYTKK